MRFLTNHFWLQCELELLRKQDQQRMQELQHTLADLESEERDMAARRLSRRPSGQQPDAAPSQQLQAAPSQQLKAAPPQQLKAAPSQQLKAAPSQQLQAGGAQLNQQVHK